jgi:hypothetical protein
MGAVMLLLLLLAFALAACQAAPPTRDATRIDAEPTAAAAFVRAFTTGDEGTADVVASPLYRYEWARRSISIEQRLAVVPHRWHRTADDPEWIRFRFEGGVRDEAGFGHLIYTAWPMAWATDDPSPSVWRVDVDPDGRVIWCELVWLFSDGTEQLRPAKQLPPGVAAGSVRLSLLSTSSPEGFYAIETNGQALLFLATGPEGKTRVAAWSYDSKQGVSRRQPEPDVAPDVAALRRSYVETL